MASKKPTIQVRFSAAPRQLDAPRRVLMIGSLGAAGTATADTPYVANDEQDAGDLVGVSEINPAVKAWFDANLQSTYELSVMGWSTAGHTANTWTVTIPAGIATQAGAQVWRFGDHAINVDITKDDDQDAVATKAVAALTASDAPLAAAIGANANDVEITSTHLGLVTQQIPVSVDLYRDRGELGVPGISQPTVVNNATGSGSPTFSSSKLEDAYDLYLFAPRATAWLDAVDTWLEAGWQKRNNFAHAISALAGTESAMEALGTTRNDRHLTVVGLSNAPVFELTGAVRVLAGIVEQMDEQGTPNISGQGVPIAIPPPTIAHDADTLLDAGITPLTFARRSVAMVRTVANYRETSTGSEDLSQFDLGAVLALAEMGDRIVALGAKHMGKAMVEDGTPLTPRVAKNAISEGQLLGEGRELLKALWREAVIKGASEDQIAQALTSIARTNADGQDTGFAMQFDPELVRHMVLFNVLTRYR